MRICVEGPKIENFSSAPSLTVFLSKYRSEMFALMEKKKWRDFNDDAVTDYELSMIKKSISFSNFFMFVLDIFFLLK